VRPGVRHFAGPRSDVAPPNYFGKATRPRGKTDDDPTDEAHDRDGPPGAGSKARPGSVPLNEEMEFERVHKGSARRAALGGGRYGDPTKDRSSGRSGVPPSGRPCRRIERRNGNGPETSIILERPEKGASGVRGRGLFPSRGSAPGSVNRCPGGGRPERPTFPGGAGVNEAPGTGRGAARTRRRGRVTWHHPAGIMRTWMLPPPAAGLPRRTGFSDDVDRA
jgi:hypothetical protein